MGNVCKGSGDPPIDISEEEDEKKNNKKKDLRKRNSQIFSLTDFIEFKNPSKPLPPNHPPSEPPPPLDFSTLKCESAVVKKSKEVDQLKMDPRNAKANEVADNIAHGNMRTMREQVIGHFSTINRPYFAQWEGDTLLHIVCREGYLFMVEFMFNPKNRSIFDTTTLVVDVENSKWRTPLHLAFTPPNGTYCASKFGGVNSLGVAKADRPEDIQIDSDWIRPGNEQHRKEIVLMLIDEGADVNRVDFHNYSPLHYAAIWGWAEVVEALADKGANLEQVNVVGDNILTLACQYNHLEVVEYIVEHTSVGVNARNAEGNTALFVAIEHDLIDIVECLLAYEADVNAVNYAKKTPLKLACAKQNTEIAHMLLDFKCQRRKSAFDLLEGKALDEIMKRLDDDEKQAKKNAEAQMAGKNKGVIRGAGLSSYGAWIPYLDKKKNEIFYYNKVSRECQYEVPKDYKKDITYVMKRASFGMHFYH